MTRHDQTTGDEARAREALFELLLRERGFGTDGPAGIRPRGGTGPAPLSFAQQRLWFLDQLEPGNAVYNVPGVLRLTGALDAAALGRALNRIVARHEVLRVRCAEADGQPSQVPLDLVLTLAEEDLSSLAPAVREARIRERAAAEADRPFDLARPPYLRATLLRLGPADHLLLFTMHHIVSDQWSLGILAGELAAFYEEETGGTAAALPALDLQYTDYAAWQQEWRTSAAFAQQLAWWRNRLQGLTPLELPADHPRPAEASFRGASRHFTIDAARRAAVERLGQTADATPFMTLLAAFQVLLYRLTRQGDVAIGTPVANRSQAQLQHLIGFFTNTLVMRASVDGHASFRRQLAEVRRTCLDAYANQELPFEALVEALQPRRELNRHPLFDVLFVLQAPLPSLRMPGVEARFVEQDTTTSKFDLTLTLRESAAGWEGWVEYRTDLFEAATINGFIDRFARLLDAVVAAPDAAIDDLPLMSADERQRVLAGFNDTAEAFDGDGLVHGLFERQVERTPDAVALVCGEQRLTYAALNARANRLAHLLQAAGVRPDVPVGICLDRSVETIVSVLAVLKAGGAYLPLDPGYPVDRLAFMLRDAGARLLLVHRATRGLLPPDPDVRVLDLDELAADLAGRPAENPSSPVTRHHLLYFMYTSGSTGRPKGATLSHHALHNLIRWHLATLLNGAATLQFAPLSFDASFHEIFAALGSGGALHLIAETERLDLDALAGHLQAARIAKVILPVVVFQQLAAAYRDRPAPFAALREIMVTGEQLLLTPAILDFCRQLPHCRLHNHYGPSEAHVVTSYTYDEPPAALLPPPPIGRPIANTQIYLLDDRLNPVPVGITAELYIGGANLARDYHHRPDLTAERFVPDPFAAAPGARLYRTGDLARWLPDGNIEYLGRRDQQVKIRGFRVEPGEVETLIGEHPDVAQAAVVVREVVPGEKSLVAFIVWAEGRRGTWEALRDFVASRLPAYLVPSFFVELPALPLTPSGKIERRSLPAPSARDLRAEFVEPRTATARWLASVWAELLGVERVGVRDNFFELGGHSLLTTRLVSRVRQSLQIDVPLRLAFEQPTIEGFAHGLAARCGGAGVLDTIVETFQQVETLSDEQASALLSDLQEPQ
ncbi:MAG: amino acid adenylation domain-containing protein [Acidobacteriota bacterium]|nr:amino acid adenylation domain-containing protein [Acidobacteriota bacterium]